jgi:hypothetical protein
MNYTYVNIQIAIPVKAVVVTAPVVNAPNIDVNRNLEHIVYTGIL